jgi:hypothetical protein
VKIGVDRPDVYRPRPKILLRENPEPVIFTLGFVLRVRGLHELLGIDEDVEAIARRRAIGETVTYEHVLVARRVARDGPGADAGVLVGSKELLPCENRTISF